MSICQCFFMWVTHGSAYDPFMHAALPKSVDPCNQPLTAVANPRGVGGLGLATPPPLRKKSSPYLGVSLWFADILSEKQCPICLRLHEKAFGNQKFPQGRPLYPFTVKYIFCQIPPPPHLNARSALDWSPLTCDRFAPMRNVSLRAETHVFIPHRELHSVHCLTLYFLLWPISGYSVSWNLALIIANIFSGNFIRSHATTFRHSNRPTWKNRLRLHNCQTWTFKNTIGISCYSVTCHDPVFCAHFGLCQDS